MIYSTSWYELWSFVWFNKMHKVYIHRFLGGQNAHVFVSNGSSFCHIFSLSGKTSEPCYINSNAVNVKEKFHYHSLCQSLILLD